MKAFNFKLAPLAAAAALSLGLAGNAQAEAYAIAYNNIFDVNVSTAPFGSVAFVFPNTVISRADATLTGFGPCANSASGALADTAACNLGSAKANNDFTPVGNVAGTFSRSDSQVVAEQTTPVSFAKAVALAESRIDGAGLGTGGASIASDTTFSIPFLVAGPSTLTFAFKADPYLQVVLLSSGLPPSVARASLDASINIVDNISGDTVFNWAPNGGAGGITGGTETADPVGGSLNRQITRNFAANGTTTADPTGDASVGVDTGAAANPAVFLSYGAFTDLLANGSYTLTLRFGARTEVQRVPEPATLALLGMGLLGLGLARRRKQQS